jgi:hypothetical protein
MNLKMLESYLPVKLLGPGRPSSYGKRQFTRPWYHKGSESGLTACAIRELELVSYTD